MEKVVAALWAPEGESREAYSARILASLPQALQAAGAHHVRLNVRDETVAPAEQLTQCWQAPQQAAVAQFWMPSSNRRFRAAVDAALASHSTRFAAWLVCESTIIAPEARPASAQPGRSTGWAQASFISFRSDMTREAAISHWHSHHTRVAIETQANFEYVQNLIVKPLTDDAPAYDAFVEECFALEAMTDPSAFFDAVGNEEKLAANQTAMMDSCAGFIDFSRIDIVPTSQFDFHYLD
ncbi:EthD domain-containing protein [Sphingobium sp. EM0848]|uniref:EthD domain-containing protein n=1 Tax=Sphingobium sp. EM0848 TaxID=2743473 RepID=UPI00159CA1F0|nr:EthD domain-containing protein [Sphingobium sp. EM0848]